MYIQGSIGYEKNSFSSASLTETYLYNQLSDTASSPGSIAGTSAPVYFGAGYYFEIIPNFFLGLGMDYSPLSNSTKTLTGAYSGIDSGTTESWKYNLKNRYSFYAMPAIKISENLMGYFKLGYSKQSVSLVSQGAYSYSGQTIASSTMNGEVFGVGIRYMVNGNIYVYAEGNLYQYSKVNLSGNVNSTGYGIINMTISPSSSTRNGLIGFGYRF